MTNRKILIIDDDVELTQLVTECLRPEGYSFFVAHDGHRGIESVKQYEPDLILLDIMLPGIDGFTLCKEIRKFSHTLILMLTARGSVDDRVTGLELGADDYLAKPFDARELSLRVSSLLKRLNDDSTPSEMQIDNLFINFNLREIKKDGQRINLTGAEFEIVTLLATFTNKAVSREKMCELVLGTKWTPESRSVDIILSRLRKKIGLDSEGRDLIKTIRGTGYMLVSNQG